MGVSDPMDEDKFKKLMDKWASHEMDAAPEIHPTAEVYQRLEDRQKKPKFSAISWPVRWAAAGIAAAIILLFIVLQPSEEIAPPVGLRKGIVIEKGEGIESAQALNEVEAPREEEIPAPAKAPRIAARDMAKREKKSQLVSGEYIFQYQRPGAETIEDVDIRTPRDKILTLSSENNYRLVLKPSRKRYVSIYQTDNRGRLIRFFPNPEFQAVQNPLQPGKTYIFPSPPNWFYVQEAEGEVAISIITSGQPLPRLDDLYARYQEIEKKGGKKEIISRLTDGFKSIEQMPEKEAELLVFRFQTQ